VLLCCCWGEGEGEGWFDKGEKEAEEKFIYPSNVPFVPFPAVQCIVVSACVWCWRRAEIDGKCDGDKSKGVVEEEEGGVEAVVARYTVSATA